MWRPALTTCPINKHHPGANRALQTVIFEVVGEVGEIGGHRIARP